MEEFAFPCLLKGNLFLVVRQQFLWIVAGRDLVGLGRRGLSNSGGGGGGGSIVVGDGVATTVAVAAGAIGKEWYRFRNLRRMLLGYLS